MQADRRAAEVGELCTTCQRVLSGMWAYVVAETKSKSLAVGAVLCEPCWMRYSYLERDPALRTKYRNMTRTKIMRLLQTVWPEEGGPLTEKGSMQKRSDVIVEIKVPYAIDESSAISAVLAQIKDLGLCADMLRSGKIEGRSPQHTYLYVIVRIYAP